ncbi:MAG: hypothetical protein F6K42_14480 [Leptolyngbya sp. SIO1D8]|nr:hypothetical protein [Leptolyngbya sp. SIO1D8]
MSSKQWAIAAALAFTGALDPLPVPLIGLHKVYLGQPLWGGVYLLLWWTQIPRIACAIEGVWYILRCWQIDLFGLVKTHSSQSDGVMASQQTHAIATALRELEQLRQEGLISEYEFEQNRRNLLDKLG